MSDKPQALIDAESPTALASLKSLAQMLCDENGLKLTPGKTFGFNREAKEVIYDPSVISKMPGYLAAALIYHNVGHAIHSNPNGMDLATFAAQTAKMMSVPQADGKLMVPITPQWIFNMVEAAEDERMEVKMRETFPNLGNTYLPRLDQGYREKAFLYQYKVMSTPTMDATNDRRHFWHRATLAIRAIVAGAISAKDLPTDMAWPEDIVNDIRAMRSMETIDELMTGMRRVLGRIVEYHELTEMPSGSEGESEDGEPQDGEGKPGKGKPGEGKPSESKPEPGEQESEEDRAKQAKGADEFKLSELPEELAPDEAMERKKAEIKKAAEEEGAKPHTCEADGCCDSETPSSTMGQDAIDRWLKEAKASMVPGSAHRQAVAMGDHLASGTPTWEDVRSTCQTMLKPVNRAIKQKLRDNELQDIASGFKAGARLNGRALVRRELNNDQRLFKRYASTGEKSYAIYLVYDISGSMHSRYGYIPSYPDVYGHFDQQECTSQLRMAVSVIEALRHFKEVQVGIGAYHDQCFPLKAVSQTLTPAIQDKIIKRLLAPAGGNQDHMGARMARESLEKVRADKKLILIMTDGGFCVTADHMMAEYNLAKRKGIETGCLVLNHGQDHIDACRGFFPGREDIVRGCNEDDLGSVIAKLLSDMIKVREVA